jgi:hypothetical protein
VLSLIIDRAYIAASRRSDRASGPRVESARRASEIHKRRTGRSLRITEADVLNEEMYEEEVDLPMHHDLLTGHLQTQNASFDRGLTAYLTSHVAMRAALDQAVWNASQHDPYIADKSQYRDTGVMWSPQQYILAGQNPLESWAQPSELSAQAKRSIVEPLSTWLPTDIQALLAIAPIEFSVGDTTPSLGMHQEAFHEQPYTYKPNCRRKSNIPSRTSQTAAAQSNKNPTESIESASSPCVSGLGTSYARPTAGTTVTSAGYEFDNKDLEQANVSTMDCLKDLVDGEGPNGTIEPSESDWEKFPWKDAWEE